MDHIAQILCRAATIEWITSKRVRMVDNPLVSLLFPCRSDYLLCCSLISPLPTCHAYTFETKEKADFEYRQFVFPITVFKFSDYLETMITMPSSLALSKAVLWQFCGRWRCRFSVFVLDNFLAKIILLVKVKVLITILTCTFLMNTSVYQ